MTWTEPAPGKWSSDKGYAIRQRDDGWMAFTPQGVPVGAAATTLADAQAVAEAHYAASFG